MNELELLKSLEQHKHKMTDEQKKNLEKAIKRAKKDRVVDAFKK